MNHMSQTERPIQGPDGWPGQRLLPLILHQPDGSMCVIYITLPSEWDQLRPASLPRHLQIYAQRDVG